MKQIKLLLLSAILLFPGIADAGKLTKGERAFLINFLEQTQKTLLATIEEVDDELWNYKPDETSWTVAGCFEHILFAEAQLTKKIMEKMITGTPDPDLNLSVNDGLVISRLSDRSNKVKTPPPFEPNGRWSTKQEMIDELNRSRAYLVNYIKSTKDDLRAFMSKSPVGEVDAYQHFLIVGGHGLRHTMQMKDIISQYQALATN